LLRLVVQVATRRLLIAIPMIFLLSILVFFILRAIPADPVAMMLPPGASQADAAELRSALGLDKPLWTQYVIWLADAVRGNLGQSIYFREPVSRLIAKTVPATLELSFVALFFALLMSVPGGLGLYALNGKRSEILGDLVVTILLSIPSFLWAIIFILLFGVAFPILPFTGRVSGDTVLPNITGFLLIDFLLTGRFADWLDAAAHLLLPALALAISFSPPVVRVLRSSLLDAERDDYVMVARLRGVSGSRVLFGHMLQNAALPTVTLIGVQFGFLFGGTLLVEVIYSFPGIGNLMVQAVRAHDLPLLQGAALVFCIVVLLTTTIVDAFYIILNPRLRTAP
jgi:ABC-type dipeptide/oligopeptide/nickel transport system permease component